MSALLKELDEMTDKRPSNAVRLTREAVDAAKIAAAYRGMTVGDYASLVVLEAAKRDIEEGHSRWGKIAPAPKRPKGGA